MIHVFKTSVRTRMQLEEIKPHIDKALPEARWNFDLDDCDRILRIDSEEDIVLTVTNLLKRHNFNCEELQ